MKILTWNIRGLNDPLKGREIRKMVENKQIQLAGILETKIQQRNLNSVVQQWLPRGWEYLANCGCSNGRILVIWDATQVSIKLLWMEEQVIGVEVKELHNNQVYKVGIVYGSNARAIRNRLWNTLRGWINSNEPWLIQGDFNVVRRVHERSPQTEISPSMVEFNQCIRDIKCDEPASKGNRFTWSTSRGEGLMRKSKIDRAFVNGKWIEDFGNWLLNIGHPGLSDHCPLILEKDVIRRKTPFKFFNFWIKNKDFEGILKNAWEEPIQGSKMFQISKKLVILKRQLGKLDRKIYSRIGKRVKEMQNKVESIQTRILNDDVPESIREEEKEVLAQFRQLCRDEENFAKQKSRQTWLSLGDSNTSFFYKKCISRGVRNRILSLKKEDGTLIEGQQALMGEAIRFFSNLLGSENRDRVDANFLHSIVEKRLNDEQKTEINKEVLAEEIKRAVFGMASDKSPGPDGFNVFFFKETWAVTGSLVTDGVLEFFKNKKMLKQWNTTILTLIPKNSNPESMSDFRPISCCNVLYKIISKILTNKLKTVLNDIVDQNQSAFVPSRSISHNILLMQGLLTGYNRKRISPRVAFKIDIRKAFDSVKWETIKLLLLAYDFPVSFVNMIMQCISSAHFIINLNGLHDGFFKSTNGIRQGDPLSPYLFVLIMEILNCIVKMLLKTESFHFHPHCADLSITHICFADDLFMLARADEISVRFLKKALTIFSSITGLQINFNKSQAFFGGVDSAKQEELSNILGIAIGKLPVRYLGVPLLPKQMKISDCRPLIEKVKNRVQGWEVQKLSYAGRIELIKSTINGIVNFWTQHFALPKKVTKEIDKITRQFLWGGNKSKVSWQKVCRPKTEGGLGIRSGKDWNEILLIKQLWAIAEMKCSLWVRWVHSRFMKGAQSIWSCIINKKMSWSLRKILKTRKTASKLISFKLGDGRNTLFWVDPWLDGKIIVEEEEFIGRNLGRRKWVTVRDIKEGECKDELERTARGKAILEIVLRTDFQHRNDAVIWKGIEQGKLKAALVWEEIREHFPESQWWKVVWAKKGVPRHQFILWLAFQDRLMTRSRIVRFQNIESTSCLLCGGNEETLDHIFFSCEFSAQIWRNVVQLARSNNIPMMWEEICAWALTWLKGGNLESRVLNIFLGAAVYEIWRERNSRLFGRERRSTAEVWKIIQEDAKGVIESWRNVPTHSVNWFTCSNWGINYSLIIRKK